MSKVESSSELELPAQNPIARIEAGEPDLHIVARIRAPALDPVEDTDEGYRYYRLHQLIQKNPSTFVCALTWLAGSALLFYYGVDILERSQRTAGLLLFCGSIAFVVACVACSRCSIRPPHYSPTGR